jgi:transposase
VQQAVANAAEILAPTVETIAAALRSAPVAHADETGIRIESKLHWMHTLGTSMLTWVGYHKKRGKVAMNAFGILPHFRGTLVHDGLESYRSYKKCMHGLCNSHYETLPDSCMKANPRRQMRAFTKRLSGKPAENLL